VDAEYGESAAYVKFWRDLQLGRPQLGEVKRLSKDGKEIWLSASYTPVLDENNKPYKVIKFAQDITAQKQAALDHQSQLEAIAKSNAVIEFDLEGHILDANENFLALMEYGLAEIKGRHHRLFVPKQEQESAAYQAFWQKLRRGEFVSGEFKRLAKGGKEIYIKGSYNAIKDLKGEPYKVVKYAQDVTTQKLLEWQSQQQAEEIRASEEEMRQNLEELSAIQEEMQRKEQEYLARIAQLEGKG
jgi:methyl-accepting chemotaxis protein